MIIEFSIVPIGKGESLCELVAKVVDIVDASGLPYKLTAMGTIVEGEWDELTELLKECHFKMKQYCSRVMTFITIDDREKAKERLEGKVEDVEEILGRRLKK
ncbi:MAG: MTH1187 family thiamine-binding protein [Candidatus Aminicenantaceae bacterium]